MYNPIPGGSSLKIGADETIEVEVHLPPVGYVWNYETKALEQTEIICRSSIPEEQYWVRPKRPDNYEKKAKREKDLKKNDPEYVDAELQEYRSREWHRRLYGAWFMNNGEYVFLPGDYYFYLAHWNLDVGAPNFKIADLHKAYFWNYCVQDPNSYGMLEMTKRRCFAEDTLIRMYDGSVKKVQDIQDGEFVMGDDSTPRLVYGTTSGYEEMFEIVPNKGEPWTCNKSHIIYGKEKPSREWKQIEITVEDYLKLNDGAKERIKLVKTGWDHPERQHFIDPYFIGAWLGDGSSRGCELSNEDEEVIQYVKDFTATHGLRYNNYGARTRKGVLLRHVIKGDHSRKCIHRGVEYKCKEHMMVALGKHRKTPLKRFSLYKQGEIKVSDALGNPVWDEMKRLNLPNNKHIPQEYKIDSQENRLRLLAGLLDTDGTMISRNGHYNFRIAITDKRERLKNDIKELIQSCGFYCGESQDKTTKAFVLNIFGEVHRIPTKIKRKQAGVNIGRKNSLHSGFTVESKGVGKYYGFKVDGNHLFLLADGTIVHNSGKTFYGAAMIYEYTSRTSNAHGGIQSKTGPDAGGVFSEKLIQPWRKLIDFFRPEYDTSQGDVPKRILRFFKPSKKGTKVNEEYDAAIELESWIDYQTSGEIAYDGQKMLRYMCDEIFKTTEANILKRHNVVKPCLENESGEIIGKAIYTSTVEEIEGAMDLYIKLWEESDHKNKNKNGRTVSGLYRWFTAAQDIMYVDKYGVPDRDLALTQIQNEIDSKTDPRDIADYIRKNPRNWKEAFRTSGEDCIYNPIKIDDRLAVLNFKKEEELFTRYNLIWEDKEDGSIPKVVPVKNRNGRFMFAWDFEDRANANAVSRRGTNLLPKNILDFVIGIDPYDHDRTKDGKFSNGAAAVYRKFNPLDEDMSDNFVAIYIGRPATAYIFYEDMVKLCHYFGCQMLFEDQKPGIKNYFNERGYGQFMVRDEKGEPGISASPKSHQSLAEHTEEFIENNCHRVMFSRLLTDWKNFTLDDTTKFDLAMASGYALIAAGKMKRKINTLNKLSSPSKITFARKFKIRNNAQKRTHKLSKSLH